MRLGHDSIMHKRLLNCDFLTVVTSLHDLHFTSMSASTKTPLNKSFWQERHRYSLIGFPYDSTKKSGPTLHLVITPDLYTQHVDFA